MWTENILCQQDSNLSWKDLSSSQTPSELRHDCFSESLYISVSVFPSWTVVWLNLLLKELPSFHSLGPPDGLMCLVLVNEKFRCKIIELAREDASKFWSDALTTRTWLLTQIPNYVAVGHCILNCCDFFSFFSQGITPFAMFRTFWWVDVLSTGERKVSQPAESELPQWDPIWFLVRRLNHSATTAWQSFYFCLCRTLIVELLCELLLSQVNT